MKKIALLITLLLITIALSGCFVITEPEASSGAVEAPTLQPLEQPPVSVDEQQIVAPDGQSEADQAYPAEETSSDAGEETTAAEAPPDEEPAESDPSPAQDPYPAEEAPPVPEVSETVDAYPAEGDPSVEEQAAEPQAVEPPQAYPAAEEAYPAQEDSAAAETVEEEPAADGAQAEEMTAEEGETAEVQEEAAPDASAEVEGGLPVYEIDPDRSEARFSIKEVLRGQPKTVVGRSSNLGGQIGFDLADPSTAQVGIILINARDFATDNEFRNRAIANEILLTNEYEFITFEPTEISGLPQTAEIGQTYAIQITGILGITDATREVTFDAQVTPVSENELAGLAAVEIRYPDFGLTIPFAQSVESVEDNVLLELEFVAAR